MLKVINGLFLKMDMPKEQNAPYVLHYTEYKGTKGGVGEKKTLEVDAVIGADGANSKVAKSIDAGDYDYAIAFQVQQQRALLVTIGFFIKWVLVRFDVFSSCPVLNTNLSNLYNFLYHLTRSIRVREQQNCHIRFTLIYEHN